MQTHPQASSSGISVVDLQGDVRFEQRRPRPRNEDAQMRGVRRLPLALGGSSERMLQEVVHAAVDICGADSAGVTVEDEAGKEEAFYRWVATAGCYEKLHHATLPRVPSVCSICLERGRPQLFTASREFFERRGIDADPATDGMMLPWLDGELRGTIWIIAHDRREAFDQEDHRAMQLLAGFAAAGVRQQRLHAEELARATAEGQAWMAAEAVQKLKRPLRLMQATAYLAERASTTMEARLLAEEISTQLEEMTAITRDLGRNRSRKRAHDGTQN